MFIFTFVAKYGYPYLQRVTNVKVHEWHIY